MRVRCTDTAAETRRLRTKAPWLCLLTGLCVLTLTARLGEHKTYAQQSPLPSTATGQIGISPGEPVAPPQPILIRTPAAAADSPNQATVQARAEMPPIPEPDPNNPVAVQTANLLKLAYDLKSEVDKTTKDTLSVAVVRKAAEIEQLAHKLRSK